MAYGAAESSVQGQVDRWAKIKQQYIVTTGTDFWSRVDATGDETYENRVKGSTITTLDTSVEDGDLGHNSKYKNWLTLHHTYLVTDLGYTGFDTWLTAMKWRVPEEFADMYYEWQTSRLTAANICPSSLTDFGQYVHDTTTFTSDSTTPATTGRGGIKAVVVVKGASTLVLKVRANYDDASTSIQTGDMNLSVTGSSPVGTEFPIGEQALTGNTSIGATSIPLAATAQFKANRQVLVYDTAAQEVATVSSILGASISVSSGLRHAYTTAASAKVRPLFDGIQSVVLSSGGNAGDIIDFFVDPDRDPTL